MEQSSEERIERAWQVARAWFEPGSTRPDSEIHVRFCGVDLARIKSCFEAIKSRARSWYTSSVWGNPGNFDPAAVGIEAMVAAFAKEKLLAMSFHAELDLGGLVGAFLLTILRTDAGEIEGRGYTRQGLVGPAATARERFSAVAGFAVEVAGMLGAQSVAVGHDLDAAVGVEGGWVEV